MDSKTYVGAALELDNFDRANAHRYDPEAELERCTCWYASYAKIEGGTGFDIAKFDPDCPLHNGEQGSTDRPAG